ncbi:(d)CMP kinase [Isachenkonia alkalipeptolytica]|uniref:Cytidylate kinase n=1 Tax=Isachenkonia alkalipeptolytica TaxID=2565777 RepID=A0AA43XKX9_9CLOT|nr:(d)CMP kinase [Isachenkonia alkalipeptolytica]NBG88758.1 (d)CMP kinase [Isachenkonia alkalipeptolytica]
MNSISVAIDGPAGAGKSTVAKEVAKRMDLLYIDTGAMYRAVTFLVMNEGIDPNQEQEIIRIANNTSFNFSKDGSQIFVNGENRTKEIRSPKVSENVSLVSKIGALREVLVKAQRKLAENHNVIMDGRDIGTHVLPEADLKVFLTASVDERARRRFEELLETDEETSISFEEVKENILLRDNIDSTREQAPLIKAQDAHEIDTTKLSTTEVIEEVISLIRKVQA